MWHPSHTPTLAILRTNRDGRAEGQACGTEGRVRGAHRGMGTGQDYSPLEPFSLSAWPHNREVSKRPCDCVATRPSG